MVLHSCDNRLCVNLDHLRLGTQQDNMDDMARRGRAPGRGLTRTYPIGDAHPNSKLTDAQRSEIADLYRSGHSQSVIATAYGVSQKLVSNIVTAAGDTKQRTGGRSTGRHRTMDYDAVRADSAAGMVRRELAHKYKVTAAQIGRIVRQEAHDGRSSSA
jgi:uncharacterized protein (DUF433 family)